MFAVATAHQDRRPARRRDLGGVDVSLLVGAADASSGLGIEREGGEAEAGLAQGRAGNLTKPSTRFGANFKARRMGTCLGSLATFGPLVRLREFTPLGATLGPAADLPIGWPRRQLGFADDTAIAEVVLVAPGTAEGAAPVVGGLGQLPAASWVATAVTNGYLKRVEHGSPPLFSTIGRRRREPRRRLSAF